MQEKNIFKCFTVNGLLGIFNHSIKLKEDSSISIITAPNGYGKTSLLKAINYFYNDIEKLFDFIFDSIEIEYTNNDKLILEKKISKPDLESKNISYFNLEKYLEIRLFTGGVGRPRKHKIYLKDIKKRTGNLRDNHITMREIEKNFPQYTYQGGGRFKDLYTDQYVSHRYLREKLRKKESIELPSWLNELTNKNVKFIETQRLLYNDSETNNIDVVKKYAKDLSEKIEQKLTKSALISQSRDRTFPKRLLENETKSNYSEKDLKKELLKLERKRHDLIDVGILDKDATPYSIRGETMNECQINVLSFYADDINQKLQVYDEIYTKIKTLKDLCNSKFKFKEMHISKEKGFYFISNNNLTLPLSELSSGEQHEIVLNYELLFLTEPNSLVLIDEPELSLHVAWQIEYIDDLEEINKISKFHALIATHSPQIINGRWNLVDELGELNNEE